MLNIVLFAIWVKKNKFKAILLIIGLFLIPLVIVHCLFKWKSGYNLISAEWTAGELIGYIAGFETFIGTVILGIIAVWQTEKANKTNDNLLELTKDTEKKSVLPFLSFNSYISKFEGNNDLISILAKAMHGSKNETNNELVPIEDSTKRIDLLLSELNFTISHDDIKITTELNAEQKEKINNPFGVRKNVNRATLISPDYHYKKIYIENCGKGSAINLKCRLYKVGNEGEEKFDIYSIPFTMPIERHFDLGLYFDITESVQGSFRLVFIYQDIYMNSYSQTIPLEVNEDEYTIDFYQSQQKL